MQPGSRPWQENLFRIIYLSDTRAGRNFDLALLVTIISSIVLLAIETVPGYSVEVYLWLDIAEWAITFLFTVEYIFRILSVKKPHTYIFSAYGIIDVLSILPTYLSVFLPELEFMVVWRAVRLLRIFRVLKLTHFLREADTLTRALIASRRKILIFFLSLLVYVVIFGTLMFIIEGPENGFTSIPIGIYWAVVTMTTTGFGDIVPKTAIGKSLSSIVMLLGYSILAVPTGIISAEIARTDSRPKKTPPDFLACTQCGEKSHKPESKFCFNCGASLQRKRAGLV